MNETQIEMAKAFSGVTFLPGSYDKRFCQSMAWNAVYLPETELTEKQAALLIEKYHRYRKQIKNHKRLCKICGVK